jgi:predicted RNase H-like HicB family nuclease
MTEIFVRSANQAIDTGNARNKLAISQMPRCYFDASVAPNVPDPDPQFITGYIQAEQTWMDNVWRLQEESRRNQFRWTETILELTDNVISIQGKLDGLAEAMARLASQRTFVVPLTSLAPEPLQMLLNIPATIEGDGEDFTATFSEANVSASGETEADAIANLKESLVSTFEFLESLPENERGPLPTRQWEVLRNVLTRKAANGSANNERNRPENTR